MNTNSILYNSIILLFKKIAINHNLLNQFRVGPDYDVDVLENQYPILYIDIKQEQMVYGGPNNGFNQLLYNVELRCYNKVMKDEENYEDSFSQTLYILNTIVSHITDSEYTRELKIKVEGNPTCVKDARAHTDDLNGWIMRFQLRVPANFNLCNSPIEPYDFDLINNTGIDRFRFQGPQGFQGLGNAGFQGPQGRQGIQGVQGPQGNQGFQGFQGFQGRQGNQGIVGVTGSTGTQGNQGFQGLAGLQGSQGFQGVQGPQGLQGYQGNQGFQGRQGIQGITGIQGFQGQVTWTGTFQVTEWSDFNTTGTGKLYLRVPTAFNGLNLSELGAVIGTTGSGATSSITLSRGRQSSPTSAPSFVDMMTTPITISYSVFDSKDSVTPAVVNSSNAGLLTGDLMRVDVLSVATASQGLSVTIKLST